MGKKDVLMECQSRDGFPDGFVTTRYQGRRRGCLHGNPKVAHQTFLSAMRMNGVGAEE